MSIDYLTAEFKDLQTDEIAITGFRHLYSDKAHAGVTIYPKKQDLVWIINILREFF